MKNQKAFMIALKNFLILWSHKVDIAEHQTTDLIVIFTELQSLLTC